MTTVTETGKIQLKIHQLTKTQYDNLETISPTELYAVDLELTGGKILLSDTNGDITELNTSSADAGKALVSDGTDVGLQYTAVIKEWVD